MKIYIRIIDRLLLFLAAFLGFFLSSSALEVFKYGGVRPEYAAFTSAPYEGPLDYVIYVWVVLCSLIFFFYLVRRNMQVPRRLVFAVLGCLLFLFLPVSWSQYPSVSLNNAILLSVLLIFSFVHVDLIGEDGAVSDVSLIMFLLLLLSLFLIVFVPSYGISIGFHSGSWQGVFSHKNNLGLAALVALVFFLVEKCNLIVRVLKISVAVLLLVGSKSYTAIAVSLLVIIGYLCIFSLPRRKLSGGVLFCLVISLLLSLLTAFTISQLGLQLDIFGKDAGFSNRNLIWGFVSNLIADRPLLGYGLATFQEYSRENPDQVKGAIGGIIGTTHNGFLDVLFSFGAIGGVGVLILLWYTFWLGSHGRHRDLVFLFLVVLIMSNGFESRMFSFNQLYFVWCYLLVIGFAINKDATKRNMSLR